MRDDRSHFLDMLIAARKIQKFATGLDWETFRQEELYQSAIIRELQVIGEAARLVSDEAKANHAEIEWEKIAGMRNRLIHEYFRISLQIVWQVAENDIEPLIEQLQKAISSEEDQE